MCEAAGCTPHPVAGPGGSRRRRLWELPAHCHCPVVGVCLPLGALRRLLGKVIEVPAGADDYALHVRCVSECGQRNALSELLQRELEQRGQLAVRRFAAAKCSEAVAALWCEAVARGDIAAALWAALTHPRCDEALTERLYREVHMLQHQAGAAVRADTERLQARAAQGEAALRELAALQERQRRLQEERTAELELLQAQAMRLRAELIGRDSLLASLRAELERLRASAPDLASRAELAQRLADATERNRELARRLSEQAWAEARRPAAEASSSPVPAEPPVTAAPEPDAPPLVDKAVLCVGGRDSAVTVYRELVERHGGRFVHHDGGREDGTRQLDAVLGAADLVICQTGCMSHNAYWLVKNHCKRTGKPCVYLERSGSRSFAQALAAAAADAS